MILLYNSVSAQVGIYSPSSMFKIERASSECFIEGGNGLIDLKVKNIGGADASFNIKVECETPFSSQAYNTIKLEADLSESFKLPIYGDTNEAEERGICSVKISDSANPDKYDLIEVPVCVKNRPLCEPEDYMCDDSLIKRCNKAGNWETFRICNEKCDAKTNKQGIVNRFCTEDIPPKKPYNLIYLVPIGILLIIGLIIYLTFKEHKKKRKIQKNKKKYCQICGSKTSMEDKHCPKCGEKT